MTSVPAGDWLTVAEVAKLLKLSKRRVQVLIGEQRIPARKIGTQFLIAKGDAQAFKAEPRTPGRPKKQ